ncbi:hypothetical protein PoB_003100500 [Plakobranchus ocellatus]|uniref:Uncharacterized protein n=1 Tax=Plakobranchus ocellatus TaxID=259542 RepID=A0AAV4ACF9_9GAST|nr:hypothetical protein PoB_003100500 [Plakobranchus ocellatus]
MNFTQLKAFCELMVFAFDDISQKEFNSYFAVLAVTEPEPSSEKFDKFVHLLNVFKQSGFSEQTLSSQPVSKENRFVCSGHSTNPWFCLKQWKMVKEDYTDSPFLHYE